MLAKELITKESLVERRRGERLGKVRDDHPSPVLQKGRLSPEEEGTCPKFTRPVKTGLRVAPEPGVEGGRVRRKQGLGVATEVWVGHWEHGCWHFCPFPC